MDNNATERAIRPFTLGRKNWVNINTVKGAETSAIIYSIVETAKANELKVYDYLEYLFTVMPEHMDDTDRSFIYNLLPWSKTVQEKCKLLVKTARKYIFKVQKSISTHMAAGNSGFSYEVVPI